MRTVKLPDSSESRHFIGGSDARIIMGQEEKALIRLWQGKRGEVGPEDLSAIDVARWWLSAASGTITGAFFEETRQACQSVGGALQARHHWKIQCPDVQVLREPYRESKRTPRRGQSRRLPCS
jgi:hypothetical protein